MMPTPTQIVQEMYAAYGRGDMDALKATLAADIEWIYHGTKEIRHAGQYRGRDGVMKFFDNVNAHIEYLDFQPRQFIAQKNMVVVLGWEKQKILCNGQTLEQNWVQIYTLSNELIEKMEEYSDTARAVQVHTC